MKKLGVLYVCTGKYDVFWDGFFESCEKYLTGIEKKYFVFTDSERILKIRAYFQKSYFKQVTF